MTTKYLDSSGLTYLWGKLKDKFQEKLVSGTNIKTINNTSLLGSGNISMADLGLLDYVTDYGTNGNWTYREWASGKIEAWGTMSKSVAITTSSPAYGGYRTSAEIEWAIPSGIFSSTPSYVLAQKKGANSARVMNMEAKSATKVAGYIASSESITITVSIYFYVVQN